MRSLAVDAPLARGEVLLEVVCAGVCGTDLSIYRGGYAVPLPLTLGHEFTARVADVARDTQSPCAPGQLAVCEINNSCLAYGLENVCAACRRGLPTHCLRRTVLGIVGHPGAFAQYVRAPHGNLHALPPDIEPEAGVFVEPLAAAIRTFELTPIDESSTVVILGCGRLGRLAALVCHKMGARVVAAGRSRPNLDLVGPYAWKRASLREADALPGSDEFAGSDIMVLDSQGLRSTVLDMTEGLGADVVVEATGSSQSLRLAQELVRPLGTVALKSASGVPVDALDTTRTAVQEIRLQGSRCGPFGKAIDFIRQHGVPNSDWITRRYPLEETQAALEAAATEPKVLIQM